MVATAPVSSKREVTESAVLARINRRLAYDGERVRRCRTDRRHYYELGDFYKVDIGLNNIIENHVDLRALAMKLGVIQDGNIIVGYVVEKSSLLNPRAADRS
jgi:hypothetical protein